MESPPMKAMAMGIGLSLLLLRPGVACPQSQQDSVSLLTLAARQAIPDSPHIGNVWLDPRPELLTGPLAEQVFTALQEGGMRIWDSPGVPPPGSWLLLPGGFWGEGTNVEVYAFFLSFGSKDRSINVHTSKVGYRWSCESGTCRLGSRGSLARGDGGFSPACWEDFFARSAAERSACGYSGSPPPGRGSPEGYDLPGHGPQAAVPGDAPRGPPVQLPQTKDLLPCDDLRNDPWVRERRDGLMDSDGLVAWALERYGTPESCRGGVLQEFDGGRFGSVELTFADSVTFLLETMPPETSIVTLSVPSGFAQEEGRLLLEGYAAGIGLEVDWGREEVLLEGEGEVRQFADPTPGLNAFVRLIYRRGRLVALRLSLAL